MPKQIWQTIDNKTFETQAEAVDHEDVIFAGWINDGGAQLSVSALWEESEIHNTLHSEAAASVLGHPDISERIVLRGLLERFYQKNVGR